jgi:hypothetical protein
MSPYYQQILKHIDQLPDTAAIPLPVAELLEGVSRKTIKRTYPLVKLSAQGKARGARKQPTQGGVIWLTSPNVSRS